MGINISEQGVSNIFDVIDEKTTELIAKVLEKVSVADMRRGAWENALDTEFNEFNPDHWVIHDALLADGIAPVPIRMNIRDFVYESAQHRLSEEQEATS